MAARKRITDARILQTIEKAAETDWRAAAFLHRLRRAEKPPAKRKDGVDELAAKRRKRRAS